MPEPKPINILCEDGTQLSGAVFEPQKLKGAVMIAPATGIKQTFYYNFTSFLAENGYGVITYDNRGIGKSLEGKVSDSNATLVDWGQLDMPAVLRRLQETFPGVNYHLVGHSAGGQLHGLMPNSGEIKSVFNFACSSGSLRMMKFGFRMKAHFFMNGIIPVTNLLFGHAKSQWVGMGEPLPKGVARDWRNWCNGTGYILTDLGTRIREHHYEAFSAPAKWVYATDDGIANARTVPDMMRAFPNSKAEMIALDPKTEGFHDIGHMKFFSSKGKKLWDLALQWLENH